MATNTCYKRFNELETGRVKGDIVDTLPVTVTSADHGKIFLLNGGTGVADTVHICIKNAADTYELKTVTLS